jgi:hypothetical protein
MPKNTTYSKDPMGVLKTEYEKSRTKKRFGRTITKTTKATTFSDPTSQKFWGTGTKTKTVTGKRKNKSKTKNLSQRKLVNLI